MNRDRRKQLTEALNRLEEAKALLSEAEEIVQTCHDEEEEAQENTPDSLRQCERYDMQSSAIDDMEEALTTLTQLQGDIEEVTGQLEEAMN